MDPTQVALNALIQEVVKITVPKAAVLVTNQLKTFKESVGLCEGSTEQPFPSAALVGLGHCGYNVGHEVAQLLGDALKANGRGPIADDGPVTSRLSFLTRWWQQQQPLYLFEPVIVLADLDNNSALDVRAKNTPRPVPQYSRCKMISLDWLYRQGAGNVQQVGQYMARVAMAVPFDSEPERTERADSPFTDWLSARSYLIDSIGLADNQTRLICFLFSTGGGTGSGMSTELGAAHNLLHHQRSLARYTEQPQEKASPASKKSSDILDGAFTLGIGIMPAIPVTQDEPDAVVRPEAQALNTGRVIANYLARQWRLEKLRDEDKQEPRDLERPPFHSLALVSNEIMRALTGEKSQVSFEEAEKRANTYIAQQLFNVLVTQSLPSDYLDFSGDRVDSKNDSQPQVAVRARDTDRSEFRRLDPADLKNGMSGLTVVGYAEAAAEGPTVDVESLLARAFSMPRRNEIGAIEGISVLPASSQSYADLLGGTKEPAEVLRNLRAIQLFERAARLTCIVSIPGDKFVLPHAAIERLRWELARLFPNTLSRRLAVIKDASPRINMSVFVSGSAALTAEVLGHFFAYVQNAFRPDDGDPEQLFQALATFIEGKTEPPELGELLLERESLRSMLAAGVGGLENKRMELEGWARQLVGKPIQFDNILLRREDCLDALRAVRSAYSHLGNVAVPRSILDNISMRTGGNVARAATPQ
jgi:hypothetical protein